ncbi:MAG: hypothetical protein Alpg2KO_26340 [Alphaproteobacteria bacterium]
MPSAIAPNLFSECFARFQMERPGNQTTISLERDWKAQNAIAAVLKDWGMSRFIPLAGAGSNCAISMPLYAGDGMVVKITPDGYDSTEDAPGQLPAVRRILVEGDPDTYAVSLWPYVSPAPMGEYAVETMRKRLAEQGFRFANGDDRADNLGQLPDGTLCVLDNGAVQHLPGRQVDPNQAILDWRAKLAGLYPRLYGTAFPVTITQTEYTSFSMQQPRWAQEHQKVEPDQKPKRRSWWPFG